MNMGFHYQTKYFISNKDTTPEDTSRTGLLARIQGIYLFTLLKGRLLHEGTYR